MLIRYSAILLSILTFCTPINGQQVDDLIDIVSTDFTTFVPLSDNAGGGPCCIGGPIPFRAPDELGLTALSAYPSHIAIADAVVTVTLVGGDKFALEGVNVFQAATGRAMDQARIRMDGSRATIELPIGTPSGVYLIADPSRPELKPAPFTLLNQ